MAYRPNLPPWNVSGGLYSRDTGETGEEYEGYSLTRQISNAYPPPKTSPVSTVLPASPVYIKERPPRDFPAAFDSYAERLQVALKQLNRPGYPVGMILWLATEQPRLYAELTERLPAEIHRLWSEHAPLEQFENALNRLLETHREACALCQAHISKVRECDEREGRKH